MAFSLRKRERSHDTYTIQFYEAKNPELEDSFLLLGLSREARILIVGHCERNEGDSIRMISTRKAAKNKRTFYQGGLKPKLPSCTSSPKVCPPTILTVDIGVHRGADHVRYVVKVNGDRLSLNSKLSWVCCKSVTSQFSSVLMQYAG